MKTIIAAVLMATSVTQACIPSEAAAPALTEVKLADGRQILANNKGLTVYSFDKDSGSTSNCYDACAKAWPPVLLEPGAVLGEDTGITVRKDGTTQLTYDGKPVYLYVGDGKSGDINGDGIGGVWHVFVENYELENH